MNYQKTKVIGLTKREEQILVNANLKRIRLAQVRSFRYLGRLVNDDGKCDNCDVEGCVWTDEDDIEKSCHRHANEAVV